jgi:hypothetical protein
MSRTKRQKQAITAPEKLFYSSAAQYYVAGRFGVLASLNPIAANLMHHAIEMYLKGALLKSKTLEELADRKKFGHCLPKCWDAFKAQVGDPGLSRFDGVIAEIQKYEELRYPDWYPASAGSMFDVVRSAAPGPTTNPPAVSYRLCLPDVDELIAAILAAAPLNPEVNLRFLKAEANEYLSRENSEATLTGRKSP